MSEIEAQLYGSKGSKERLVLSIIYLAKLLASHKPFILKIVAIGITVEFVLTCAREYEECNMLRCDDTEQKYKSKLLFSLSYGWVLNQISCLGYYLVCY